MWHHILVYLWSLETRHVILNCKDCRLELCANLLVDQRLTKAAEVSSSETGDVNI